MPKLLITTLAIFALAGCASTATETSSEASGSKSTQNCEIVKSTGGRLGRKVCTPAG